MINRLRPVQEAWPPTWRAWQQKVPSTWALGRPPRDMDATKAGHQGGTGDADAGRLLSWASMNGGIATHPSVMPTAMTAVR